MAQPNNTYMDKWSTVSMMTSADGLTAREDSRRFKIEILTEIVLRLFGGLLVVCAPVLWVVMQSNDVGNTMISGTLLAAIAVATGLVVYAYGTRGFRRQLSLDARNGTLALTKVNINNQGRVVRTLDLDDVESLFLRRPATRGAMAALCVRMSGGQTPLLALTGEMDELSNIHADLCEIISGTDPLPGQITLDARFPAARGVARA